MRVRPPITVEPEAAVVLCLLTKHQLIDLVVDLVRGESLDTDGHVINLIESLARPLLRRRNENCPNLSRVYAGQVATRERLRMPAGDVPTLKMYSEE